MYQICGVLIVTATNALISCSWILQTYTTKIQTIIKDMNRFLSVLKYMYFLYIYSHWGMNGNFMVINNNATNFAQPQRE